MNKLYFSLLSIFTVFSLFPSQNQTLNSMKMSFSIAKNQQAWGSDIVEKDVQECINFLKKMAAVQKKRNLTLEEITLALNAAIYILSFEYEQHSGQIQIVINEKEKIVLPFSSEMLINLLAKSLEVASKDNDQTTKNNSEQN